MRIDDEREWTSERPVVRLGQGDYEKNWTPDEGLIVGAMALAFSAIVAIAIGFGIVYAIMHAITHAN